MNVNQLLQESVYDIPRQKLDVAKELQEKGIIKNIQEKEYVYCVSPDDEDYFEVKDIGCNEKVEIEDSSNPNVTCPGCGRNIELRKKDTETQFVLIEIMKEYIPLLGRDSVKEPVEAPQNTKMA
ncbi:hypothetical protein ACM16X_02270 [Haloarcula japonica]|uniref:hypothetical protein n=1 Tax=Haloarcula japonica TaxID=29282 RepID=UPI0039F6F67B